MEAFMHSIFDLNNTSYWHPLLWVLGASFVLSLLPRKTVLSDGKLVQRWYWSCAIALVLPIILWTGYRRNFVDTWVYINSFNSAPSSLSEIPSLLTGDVKDPGYSVLVIVLKWLGVNSSATFLLIIATVQMLCMAYTFRKYTEHFWIPIFLFVASTDYYSWMQNGMRQFLACCLIFGAFDLQVRRKYLRFTLVVLLASTIHGSALLMLPFAFIMSGPALNYKTMLLITATALMMPFIDSIEPIVNALLSDTQYSDMMTNEIWANDDGTNLIRVAVYSVPALVALIGHRYIRGNMDPAINLCVNASMITMAMYLISVVTSGIYIGRVPIYTTLHGYMILPWMLDQIFEKQSARIMKFLMVVFYVAFYYYQMGIHWGYL